MRRLMLTSFLLLWIATPAGGLTLRPERPSFEPPRGRPLEVPPPSVPVGPGFETPPSGSPFDVPPDLSLIGPRLPLTGAPGLGLRPLSPPPSGVPEPGAALLLALGLSLVGARRLSARL